MSAVLRVENLSYKDILGDISFEIEKNSFNVLIGPNCCGKTTLVKCLAGLLKCNGNIFLNNQVLSTNDNFSIRKDIGIIINSPFYLNNSVMDNLMTPLINLGYSEIESKKKIYSISDKLGLGSLIVKNISDLNVSEKRMLTFFRGIIHEPKVIIIDDIFGSLNNFDKEKIINYLKKLKNTTIVFVTNNEENILYANEKKDSVIVMNEGKIITKLPLKEIIKQEKLFIKSGLKLPFIVDLSYKLQAYGLLEDIILNIDEMVEKIWQ